MRYPASEKLEIIRIVEQSHLPARRTLGQLGIPRATFHRWYDRFLTGGVEALEDRSPKPGALGLTVRQAAELATVSHEIVIGIEASRGSTKQSTIAKVRAALEAAGVIFLENGEGPGVKLRKGPAAKIQLLQELVMAKIRFVFESIDEATVLVRYRATSRLFCSPSSKENCRVRWVSRRTLLIFILADRLAKSQRSKLVQGV